MSVNCVKVAVVNPAFHLTLSLCLCSSGPSTCPLAYFHLSASRSRAIWFDVLNSGLRGSQRLPRNSVASIMFFPSQRQNPNPHPCLSSSGTDCTLLFQLKKTLHLSSLMQQRLLLHQTPSELTFCRVPKTITPIFKSLTMEKPLKFTLSTTLI